jgi:hypothetical protein
MFPKVRKIFSKAELEELGAQMEELKTQLIESPQEQPTS